LQEHIVSVQHPTQSGNNSGSKQQKHTVSSQNVQHCFSQIFIKFLPTLIIFDTKMAKGIKLC